MPVRRSQLAILALLPLLGCQGGGPTFARPQLLGGVEVAPDVLNEGRDVYVRTCAACHGDDGDGRGPAAPGLTVPPRDFTRALFKYASVPAGELPTDADLLRTLWRGLAGTPMLPWDLTRDERHAVVQYLKTFSPRWRRRRPPPPIVPTPDPWQGREARARERGEALYHVRAQCSGCHGAYAPREDLQRMSVALTGQRIDRFPDDLFERRPRESEFFAGTVPVRIVASDFLEDRMKAGDSLEDLYRTIGAGVGGTAMPRWQGALPEEDLWALVHYTKHLVDLRGTPAAQALRQRLR